MLHLTNMNNLSNSNEKRFFFSSLLSIMYVCMYEVWFTKENLLTGRLKGREEEEKKRRTSSLFFLCASSSQRERSKRDVWVYGTREFLPLLL